MSLNWKEIDLVLSELSLPGCQVQKAFQPNYDSLALVVYGKTAEGAPRSRTVLFSLSPGACRLHETARAVPKSDKPLRFAEFLKARIVNGHIEEAAQLGRDRIVRLAIRRGEKRYLFYARLWSNAANIIVADESGAILDAMKRRPRRGEATGGVYRPEEKVTTDIADNLNDDTYAIRDLPGAPGSSFNEKIDAYYAEHGGALSLEALREEARRFVERSANRLGAALERLREKESDYRDAEKWKEKGDALLSGAGDKASVKEAQECYEKYRKAKSGLAEVRAEIREAEAESERLAETEKTLLACDNPLALEKLLKHFRKKAAGGTKDAKKRPGLSFRSGDWLLLVGRDAAENDELLRRHVRGNDLWVHARDYAGSYIFVKCRSGKTVPLDILLEAGNLAIFYSKGRNNGSGNCYYTPAKYLRRAKGAKKGTVLPSQEKNIFIKLDKAILKKLEDAKEI